MVVLLAFFSNHASCPYSMILFCNMSDDTVVLLWNVMKLNATLYQRSILYIKRKRERVNTKDGQTGYLINIDYTYVLLLFDKNGLHQHRSVYAVEKLCDSSY